MAFTIKQFLDFCKDFTSTKPRDADTLSRKEIEVALGLEYGSVDHAAEHLKVSELSLRKRMEKLRLKPEDYLFPDNVGMPGIRR